ncbi:MAG: hypothetical protein GYB35_08220, partial [Algicola sp.]|nr:hypothetical protein [Algicola sp.]
MASVNFLYRSKKPEALLQLRLLYRHNNVDYVLAGKTQLLLSKNYWNNLHKLKKPKDIDVVNMQHDVNTELNTLE